jgi:hypothetical protein
MSDTQDQSIESMREELERLRAAQAPTVTITTTEYERLKANQGSGIDREKHQRQVARLAEVEQLLRREMQEHAAEIAALSRRLEHK